MRSSAGSELLARCKIVGTPAAGIPRNTVSMKLGLAGVPNSALKIWMQVGLLAALRGGRARGQRPRRAEAAGHGQRRRGGEHLALDGHEQFLS